MSAVRKARRQMIRKMPKISNENADRVIAAVNSVAMAKRQEARRMAPEIVADVERKMKSDIIPSVQGYMIMLVLAYMHCEVKDKWGTKRIKAFIHGFNAFADQMLRDGVESSDLREMLEAECKGLDILAEFQACDNETQAREKKRVS